MAINFINCGSIGNKGDGIRVSGDVDVTFDGVQSRDNDGHGFNILSQISLMDQLGVPSDTDLNLVKEILSEINSGNGRPTEDIIKNSSLFGKIIEIGANLTTVSANFSTVAASPGLQSLLRLCGA